MAALGLAVAVPATILIAGGSGGPGDGARSAPPAARIRPLGRQAVGDTSLGIAVNPPHGWAAEETDGVVTLTSPDLTVRLAVSAPTGPGRAGKVLDDATAAIRSGYEDVTAIPGAATQVAGREVGGLSAESSVLEARSHGGTQLRILVSAASGGSRTYLVELFTAADAPAQPLADAQLALQSLRLTG